MFEGLEILDAIQLNFSQGGLLILNFTLFFIMFGVALEIKLDHIKEVFIKPKVVVSVTYQNIQKSPGYSSGYALRFPRIMHYRPERGVYDIASLDEIKKDAERK